MHAASLLLRKDATVENIETVHDNVYWAGAAPRLSIVIPTYRYDCSDLIDALARCKQSSLVEIVVYDDGSRDHDLLARMEQNAGGARAAVRIVAAWKNRGSAAARNSAMAHARSEWVLLLDADMSPEGGDFIQAWMDAADRLEDPAIVVGGQSLRFASSSRKFALHRWRQMREDCLPAERRNEAPGRYVSCSNLLVHKDIFDVCPFDDGFAGAGWEDVEWGLRAQRRFPVHHIDNNATHVGLEDDRTLIARHSKLAANFARMAKRHPIEVEAMPLYRAALASRTLPFRRGFKVLARLLARSPLLPVALRGRAMDAWRALAYAEAL